MHLRMSEAVCEDRQYPYLTSRISVFRRQCEGGPCVCPRRLKIRVVKRCNSQLSQRTVLPFGIAQLPCEIRNLQPVVLHRCCIHFRIDVALDDETEHPEFFVTLQQWI